MPTVFFRNENRQTEVPEGTTILQAARGVGIVIESPCGGNGTCGKCTVNIISTGSDEAEETPVLACRTKVNRDLTVETIKREKNDTMQILSSGESVKVRINLAVSKRYDAVSGTTRVNFDGVEAGSETGDTAGRIYGVSVDIGTTTLVVALIDLLTGKTAAEESALNPQAVFAQDVLSRISFAKEDGGLDRLYHAVSGEIGRLIHCVADKAGVDVNNIYEAVYSGNTCMLHLAAGVNPDSLGSYPYTPRITGGCYIGAAAAGIRISPFGRVYLPSVISAYVGADITSGILASGLGNKNGTTLFVDIGTNGEMVIARGGRLSATSTAAGPAFEGMNIACGMRASNGAVEQFDIDESGVVAVKTIGNSTARGICGSGLIDIAGELVANRVIEPNGRFTKKTASLPQGLAARLVPLDSKTVFRLAEGVYLTQKDVRQIQLAKGAVRAGVEYLMQSVGVTAGDVDEVLIAGSFGYHLRAKSLINIGLLPKEFDGKIRFIGNTSRTGGEIFLLDRKSREDMLQVTREVNVIELANYKDFDRLFVKCLNF